MIRTDQPDEGRKVEGPIAPIVIVDDHALFATSLLLNLRQVGLPATTLPVPRLGTLLQNPIPATNSPARTDPRHLCGSPEAAGLVLLDLDLGAQSESPQRLRGADLVAGLLSHGWHVLVITGSEDQADIAAAFAAGALGVVEKTDDFDHLVAAVRQASRGESLISAAERDRWVALAERCSAQRRERDDKLAKLSPREREVLDLLAEGHRAAAISEHFVVSIATVRAQIRSILAKTESNSQLEAIAFVTASTPGTREALISRRRSSDIGRR